MPGQEAAPPSARPAPGGWKTGSVRIAMVCLGNICRSPMAEVVARALLAEEGLATEVSVESFGTAGYHAGEGADPRARAALGRRGLSADGHRARQIAEGDVAALDLVLCADRSNMRAITRLAPAHAGKLRLLRSYDPLSGAGDDEVPDPWGGLDGDFDDALALIEAACRGLVGELAAARR